MAETVIPAVETARPKSLLARAVGVVVSPRATYAEIAERPRFLGAMLVVIVVSVAALMAFSSTDAGKSAMMEQMDRTMQSMGRTMSDAQYAQLEARVTSPAFQAVGAIGQVVLIPVIGLVAAGLILAVFNAILGGNASFLQVFAIVVHSWFLQLLQQFFVLPLDYVKQSLSSPTNLAVFMPFLDEGTFAARFFGFIDLFRIWWIVNLAIGIGVLYKRRTTPIATTMLVLYVIIALIAAAVGVALSGA